MKLFILTIAKEQTYYSFDFEKDIYSYFTFQIPIFYRFTKSFASTYVA